MSEHPLIYRHPHVASGAPCIVGTRTTVREIQERMKKTVRFHEVIASFDDHLTIQELRAAEAFPLSDVRHSWRTGYADILEGEPVLYVQNDGTAKIPLDDVPTALAAMQAAYDEWRALDRPDVS